MKRLISPSIIIILLFSVSVPVSSFAQGLKFGIKAGASMYKIDGTSFKDEFRYGYHVGGAVEIMLGEKIGIQPEVLFNQSNVQTGYAFDTLYHSINAGMVKDVKLNYMTIPVLLNIRPIPLLSFQIGPQFGILMSKEKSLLEDGKSAFKSGNFSMVGGVQLNISFIRVYGRYGIGLNNLNDIDGRDKWKSQTAQFGAAVMF
ncbi:porin family protein [Pollutibacter soli]|uniref:porin family protein n=1 Tax=Pollutibacter soli TaxID=3034157 RepID=UPI003013F784